MKRKPSIKPSLSIKVFGINRFYLGLVIALFSSIISYFFLLNLREICQFSESSFTGFRQFKEINPWTMTISDFILAMLACQLGQKAFFEFCFFKPTKKIFEHSSLNKSAVLVDNRNLLNNFLFIGLKIAFVSALLLGSELYNLLAINGIVFWIFILSIITIHFNAWQTIIRNFKNSQRWVFLTFFATLVFSLLLIQVNLIDYQKINQDQLNRIPDYQLKVVLPESKHQLFRELYGHRVIPFTLQQNKEASVLMNHTDTIPFSKVSYEAEKIRAQFSPYHEYRIIATLKIDKHVKMEEVFKLKQALREANFTRIAYILFPPNNAYWFNPLFSSLLPVLYSLFCLLITLFINRLPLFNRF